MQKIYTQILNRRGEWRDEFLYPISIFFTACLILLLSSFSTKAEFDNAVEFNSIESTELTDSNAEFASPMFMSCCSRNVSNTYHCIDNYDYVFWLQSSGNPNEPFVTNGGSISWIECDDGTAKFTATGLTAVNGGSETINVNFTFTGRTHNPPSDSPKGNTCGSEDSSDWVYYTGLSGSFTSNHHGTHTVKRSGPSFQVGDRANTRAASGFGGSGWFDVIETGKHYSNGDVNIQLSPLECTAPNPTCSGGDYSFTGMDRFIEPGTTQRCYNLSGAFAGATEIDITEIITFDCYDNRTGVNQPNEQLKVIFKNADGHVIGESGYTTDLDDNVAKASNVQSLGKIQLSAAGATQVCVVHYEDPANGSGSANSANSLNLTSLCLKITNSCNASNFDAGMYDGDYQAFCNGGDAVPITPTDASGCNGGTIEYRWFVKGPDTGGEWSLLNETGASYDPPYRNDSYWYSREARCAPCGDWVKTLNTFNDSNGNPAAYTDVHVSNNYDNPGSIGSDQEYCGTSADPSLITNVADPSGGYWSWDQLQNMKWQSMTLSGIWQDLIVDDGQGTKDISNTYDPSTIHETTKYRRCVRVQPCTSGEDHDGWVCTEPVTVTLNIPCHITKDAADHWVECDGNGNTAEFNDFIDSNGYANSSSEECSWSYEIINEEYTCGNSTDNGTRIVTVRFTLHSCDKDLTTTGTFTVGDTTAPHVTCKPNRTVACFSDIVAEDPDVTEDCTKASVSHIGPTLLSGTDGCDGAVYEIEYKVESGCKKNVAFCTQTFTIDSAEPTINCAADKTVDCIADISADINSVTTTAACGDNGSVTADGPNPAAGNSACGENDGDQYTITYTITDACNRTAHCTQTFTIDSAEPTINCAADKTVDCIADISVDLNSVSTSAACGDNGNVTADGPNPVSGNSACGESDGDQYTITYTITDACGRTAECTQTFTIDSAEPTISCAADETVTCFSDISVDLNSVSTSAACGDNGNVTADGPNPVSGNSACGESDGDQYTITYTITDACGRTAECTQTFTIDSAEPTISCPADEVVECYSDIAAQDGAVTFSTGCGLGGDIVSGAITPVGSNSACGE